MWCAVAIVVLLALAGMAVGLIWLARKLFRDRVRSQFIEFLQEERPDMVVVGQGADFLAIRRGDGEIGQMYLHKLFAGVLDLDPDTPEGRREVFDHFLRSITELEDAAAGELSLEEHGDRIMPRLVPPAFLKGLPPDSNVPFTPLDSIGLNVVYVLNAPNSVMYITGAHAQELGLDAAGLHERALANLNGTFPADDVVRSVLEENSMPMLKLLDSFDAARLLLIPRHVPEGKTLVALIPDRDTLCLTTLPSDGDWSGLRKLARTPGSDNLVLDRPVKVTNRGFELA